MLGRRDLIATGLSCCVGVRFSFCAWLPTAQAGIFLSVGAAAASSGAGLLISLLIASFMALLSGLCYAEYGASLPVPGSTYSYTYATFGELVGWL